MPQSRNNAEVCVFQNIWKSKAPSLNAIMCTLMALVSTEPFNWVQSSDVVNGLRPARKNQVILPAHHLQWGTIHTRVSSTVCNGLFMRGLHRNRSWATPCLRDWTAWYTLRYKWWYTARYTHCDYFAHAMFLVGQFLSNSNKFVPQVKAGFLTRSRHCQNWFEAERKTIVLGAQGAEGTLLFFSNEYERKNCITCYTSNPIH